jgi:hypothetical protein
MRLPVCPLQRFLYFSAAFALRVLDSKTGCLSPSEMAAFNFQVQYFHFYRWSWRMCLARTDNTGLQTLIFGGLVDRRGSGARILFLEYGWRSLWRYRDFGGMIPDYLFPIKRVNNAPIPASMMIATQLTTILFRLPSFPMSGICVKSALDIRIWRRKSRQWSL